MFNFRARVIVGAAAGSINYLFSFVNKKIYYDLETTLSMPGVSLFYCTLSFIGLIVMYLILPETEGRSLEDIELHYSDDSKKITDRQIAISQRNVDPEIWIHGKDFRLCFSFSKETRFNLNLIRPKINSQENLIIVNSFEPNKSRDTL